jgi:hypothetical protein
VAATHQETRQPGAEGVGDHQDAVASGFAERLRRQDAGRRCMSWERFRHGCPTTPRTFRPHRELARPPTACSRSWSQAKEPCVKGRVATVLVRRKTEPRLRRASAAALCSCLVDSQARWCGVGAPCHPAHATVLPGGWTFWSPRWGNRSFECNFNRV